MVNFVYASDKTTQFAEILIENYVKTYNSNRVKMSIY